MEEKVPVLRTQHLGIAFGGLHAVEDFNIEIYKGELVGLIGPNGAGKTTVFNLLTGVYKPTEGTFYLNNELLNGKKTHQIVEAGIARTFQNIRLFGNMKVIDNVKTAFSKDIKYGLCSALFRSKAYWKTEREIHERAMELLKIFHLEEKAEFLASSLPYGEQRKLEIARALATDMKLLLLDEPSMGLSPLLVSEIFSIIEELHKDGITILLVEQNAKMALSIADRAYVLENGRITMSGNAKELLTDERIKKAYLGA